MSNVCPLFEEKTGIEGVVFITGVDKDRPEDKWLAEKLASYEQSKTVESIADPVAYVKQRIDAVRFHKCRFRLGFEGAEFWSPTIFIDVYLLNFDTRATIRAYGEPKQTLATAFDLADYFNDAAKVP